MATREQVRDAMHRQPFLGFTVRLVDGRSFLIKHPDFVSIPMTERGRDLVIHDQAGTHRIDLLHVIEVEEPDPGESVTAETQAAGNGE